MLGQGAIILPTILRKVRARTVRSTNAGHTQLPSPIPSPSIPGRHLHRPSTPYQRKQTPREPTALSTSKGKKPIQAQPRTEPERRYRSGTGSTGSTGSTFLPPDATPARPARHRISCARVEDQQRNSEDQRGPARTSEDQQRTSRGLARAALQDGRRS
ncbi:hypothetical protein VC83_06729 [Pseudogymnoascus destructans]|uniref:Uncharacterized protein n=1 Tax=Pseudogymnoascus destructans TaxID=655981 RepID=A0A177A4I3_9PEZI|nr:uncharacterized protein VC83_06729 [Pseudogymnoascus destructans]OAF56382.1 hypothetical protein VC83_06729 [Pseudogymnoascus destructans]